jgi:pyruvate kinase
MSDVTPKARPGPARTRDDQELFQLHDELLCLRAEILRGEQAMAPFVSEERQKSVANLCHYLALRRKDIRPLQSRLSRLGLSSLGRCEAHVLSSVDAVVRMLGRATGGQVALPASAGAPTFDEGPALLRAHEEAIFGPRRDRATRIMVTLSASTADDPRQAERLLEAGTDAVRINCAHDDRNVWARMIEYVRAASGKLGRRCVIHADLAGPKIRTCGVASPIALAQGQSILLAKDAGHAPGIGSPVVGCTLPAALDAVRTGDPVWFDDGKLGGIVERVAPEGAVVRITHARKEGLRLTNDRGINLPDSPIDVAGFTGKDREDLQFIALHADTVALSFAQRSSDVRALQEELRRLGRGSLGVILKIETRRGFESLPRLLLDHTGPNPLGVMIARGDLAIEVGYERMAEVQEEILWICEAAHVPVIWATQVLETLAKDGMPTRAEVTDAAAAARAECVMLNKGKHVVETVRILDDILRRMADHQQKKSPTFRALRVSGPIPE